MTGWSHGNAVSRAEEPRISRHALHRQVQLALTELSTLTHGLLDAASGDASGAIREASIDEIDSAFAAVAGTAVDDLLDVRPSRWGMPSCRAGASRHRILVGSPPDDPAQRASGLAEVTARGALVRTLDWVPVRVAVADGRTVAAALDDGRSLGYLLVERGSRLARSASHIVEVWWNRAQPVGTALPAVGGAASCAGRSTMEAAIISALANGETDDTVARRLGVTPRTVRRYVADISERFGATSRLQLGVLLERSSAVKTDQRTGVRGTAAG